MANYVTIIVRSGTAQIVVQQRDLVQVSNARVEVAGSGGGAGVSDHGGLTGLGDDDHPHYFNQVRGDARYALATAYAALVASLGGADPFPQYLTPAEATAVYAALAHSHAQADITGLVAALAAKAPLAAPAFSGVPTAPTAAANTNTAQIATTAFVATALAQLVASSPAALDTLAELAAALGNDANFATTITTQIGTKLNASAVSAFMLTLLAAADAATARTTLGLGSAALAAASAFAAAVHAHAIADVTGLTGALTAKAAVGHSHTAADVADFIAATTAETLPLLAAHHLFMN
jgi:Phage tail repeat like